MGPEAETKLSGRGTVASGVMAFHACSATPPTIVRRSASGSCARSPPPQDQTTKWVDLRRAPIRRIRVERVGHFSVREGRAARGPSGEGPGRRRVVDALRVRRSDHERLEGITDLGREAPPHARRLEEQRLVLASPQLAVEGGREAGVAEERIGPVDEGRRQIDRAGGEGVGDESLRRRRLGRRRLAGAGCGAAVGQAAVETFAGFCAVADAVAAGGDGDPGHAQGGEGGGLVMLDVERTQRDGAVGRGHLHHELRLERRATGRESRGQLGRAAPGLHRGCGLTGAERHGLRRAEREGVDGLAEESGDLRLIAGGDFERAGIASDRGRALGERRNRDEEQREGEEPRQEDAGHRSTASESSRVAGRERSDVQVR